MRYFIYMLTILSMMNCQQKPKQYQATLIFDASSDQDFVYNSSLIDRRLSFQDVIVTNAKKIGDRSISFSLETTMDTSLLRQIVETRGIFSMHRIFSNEEASPFMDKLYAKALELKLVPEVKDDFLESSSRDLTNFLERNEFDASHNTFDPVIAKVKKENYLIVDSILRNEQLLKVIPEDVLLRWREFPSANRYELIAIKKCDSVVLCVTNDWIESAISREPETGKTYGLFLDFKEQYNRPFFIFTRNNTERNIAIVLDDKVLSYAEVAQPIEKGEVDLNNTFDATTVQCLVACLNTGTLKGNVKLQYRDTASRAVKIR